jgi:Na+/melibiose symporter-like transporter
LFAAIPVVALLVALILLAFYPLSEARMRTIRQELEARRGTV